MEIFKGKRMHGKIGMGPVKVFNKAVVYNVYKTLIQDRVLELERLKKAYEHTDRELREIAGMAKGRVGRKEADIFEAHRMLLSDDNFKGEIKDMIVGESVCAEYAVNEVAAKYEEFFKNSPNAEMKSRAADIRDVSGRIISNLMGKHERLTLKEPAVIVAEDLSPSELISLERKYARAIVVTRGSLNSHAAIIARSMDIPMVLIEDEKILEIGNGRNAVVDGEEGLLIVEPDLPTYERYVDKLKEQSKEYEDLNHYLDKEAITKSGHKIILFANASGNRDIDDAVTYNAEGIGLFRTEFLFMNRDRYLDEEEQLKIYSDILKRMKEKPVTFRTMDVGSDKSIPFLSIPKEDNPALGLRGIRLSLAHEDIFKVQLKALLRAARFGNMKIMYPMVTSVDEMVRVREIMADCIRELKSERKKFAEVPQGIMIETPGAVMIADELAEYADFFSIGTNDLTQYALAMDRQNGHLINFFNPHHPAIMKMIDMVVKSGHKAGIPVGVCGEMAMDPDNSQTLVDMGIDYLSVNAPNVLRIRKSISNLE